MNNHLRPTCDHVRCKNRLNYTWQLITLEVT